MNHKVLIVEPNEIIADTIEKELTKQLSIDAVIVSSKETIIATLQENSFFIASFT